MSSLGQIVEQPKAQERRRSVTEQEGNASQTSSTPSSLYLKVCVAQSIEALEHLNHKAELDDDEIEGDIEPEKHRESAPHEASSCAILCGYIDGYVKQACSSAQVPPLSLVPDELVTIEIACKSRGADYCEFVTAHIDRIAEVVTKELDERVLYPTPGTIGELCSHVNAQGINAEQAGVMSMLKIVRSRQKSGRGWLAHCLETSSPDLNSSSPATANKT